MKTFYENKNIILRFDQITHIKTWEDALDIYMVGSVQPTSIYNKNSIPKIVEDFKAFTDCYLVEDLIIPLNKLQCVHKGEKSYKIDVFGLDRTLTINKKPSMEKFRREFVEYLEGETL